jgi:lipopolysaccharide biosynthesis protein
MAKQKQTVEKSVRKRRSAPERTCVLVLGMHRSGTSALTRTLSLLGCQLPRYLMGAAEGNDAGHWEPYNLVSYNDRLLESLHSNWHDWKPLDLTGIPVGHRQQAQKDIRNIIDKDYGDSSLFVVKDPRICRFPSFFIEAVEESGVKVVPVLIVRNPLEVSASLESRTAFWPQGFTAADCALLWLSHVLESERDTRGLDRAVVAYDALLADWRSVTAKVSDQTGLRFPVSSEEAAPLVQEFLRGGLRHHAKTADDVALDPVLGGWVSEAFEALMMLSVNPSAQNPRAVLDRIYLEFRRASPILNNFLSTARQHAAQTIEAEQQARQETSRQLEEVAGTLSRTEAAFSEREAELAIARGEIDRLTGDAQQLSDERGRLSTALAEERQVVLRAKNLLGAGPGDNRALDQLVDDWKVRLDKAEADARAVHAELDELSRKATAKDQHIAQLEDAHGESERLREAAVKRFETAKLDLEQVRGEAQAELARHQDQLDRVRASELDARRLADSLAQRLTATEAEASSLRDANQSEATQRAQALESLARREADYHALGAERDVYRAQADAVDRERNLARAEEKRLQEVLDTIYNSTSWRLTSPVRGVMHGVHWVGRTPRRARNLLSRAAYAGWHRLPLSFQAKSRLKATLFRGAPFLFGSTNAYQAWKSFSAMPTVPGGGPVLIGDAATEETSTEASTYTPLLHAAPLADKPVRVVAFYLPQFHPIAENNEWWGEGFTEWTNVKPSEPQFVGHYQPHVPGELGYYDLRDKAVQRRQIELAKLYGVEGFCFYFYWFGGKRLLETPLENWLADPTLDLPFCLCWANENWSRRWDGLDQEILIAQDHSAEDDIAFIAEAAPYLADPRYIRVDGKPLLMVYRPSLLPSARETAERWRDWCRRNGIGEIFLAYPQSFERSDPALYGFDAAIEFPPNNSAPPNVTDTVTPLRGEFGTTVYDWSVFPARSEHYEAREYPLFRSVCPGWDNTARRKNKGIVFVNNTPALYRRWLDNAIDDTLKHARTPSERIVFVNAWNEWAEGAHLEPDERNGYAYLQATRNALLDVRSGAAGVESGDGKRVAIVVHAYYPEILEEILDFVARLPRRHKLFVTTTPDKYAETLARLEASGRDYVIRVFPNRGRDVLPFMKIFPAIEAEGFEYLVKVHTKRSLHREDGDTWRRDLYGKLLDNAAVEAALTVFEEDASLGLVGPDRHFVPMSTYIGSNEGKILDIGGRLGLSESQIRGQGFFAGTMFMARISALRPLMRLGFGDDDFEVENGQIDGTFAHAIERGIALSVGASGLRHATNADLHASAVVNDRYGFA